MGLKIIWVFSKKKDAASDTRFSLTCQQPTDDPRKVVVHGELSLSRRGGRGDRRSWGWKQSRDRVHLLLAAKEATAHRRCWADLTCASTPVEKELLCHTAGPRWESSEPSLSKTACQGGWLWLFLLLTSSQLATVKRHLRWEKSNEKRL